MIRELAGPSWCTSSEVDLIPDFRHAYRVYGEVEMLNTI